MTMGTKMDTSQNGAFSYVSAGREVEIIRDRTTEETIF